MFAHKPTCDLWPRPVPMGSWKSLVIDPLTCVICMPSLRWTGQRILKFKSPQTDGQTKLKPDRLTDRLTDRQKDRRTDRQTNQSYIYDGIDSSPL